MGDDRTTQRPQRRALRAAYAVTLGAFALTGCPDDDPTPAPPGGWDLGVTRDMAADMAPDMTVQPDMTAHPDMEVACSTTPDDTCPVTCSMNNDADCCEQMGGIWSGGCGVPGPFTPPRMPAAALA